MILGVDALAVSLDLGLPGARGQIGSAGDEEQAVDVIGGSRRQVGQSQRVDVLQIVGVTYDRSAQIFLRVGQILQLQR